MGKGQVKVNVFMFIEVEVNVFMLIGLKMWENSILNLELRNYMTYMIHYDKE